MAANSKIEWTTHTFNPWIGCAKVHEGCTNCYAEAFAKRTGKAKWGPNGTRIKTSADYWKQALKWNREAECASERPRVFCASLADIFEEWSGRILDHHGEVMQRAGNGGYTSGQSSACPYITLDDLRRDLFTLIDATPNLDWLLLTKRPENIRKMWLCPLDLEPCDLGHSRPNVWLGTSVSSQQSTDGINHLLACRDLAPVLFLSCEPLVGSLDLGLRNWADEPKRRIDLVIVGGESGHGARPMHPDWARLIRDDCQQAGVAFFFKQWGDWLPALIGTNTNPAHGIFRDGRRLTTDSDFQTDETWARSARLHDGNFHWITRVGKKAAGRELDGREWNEMPEVCHV